MREADSPREENLFFFFTGYLTSLFENCLEIDKKNTFAARKPVLWIRVCFLRIRVRIRVRSLMLETGGGPGAGPGPDPDPIRCGSRALVARG